jgi:hypothetical protein
MVSKQKNNPDDDSVRLLSSEGRAMVGMIGSVKKMNGIISAYVLAHSEPRSRVLVLSRIISDAIQLMFEVTNQAAASKAIRQVEKNASK